MSRRMRWGALVLCGLMLFGTAAVSFANGQSEKGQAADAGRQAPAYTGSIVVPEQTGRSADLSGSTLDLAKVSMEEAGRTVLAKNPGARLLGISLDVENGFLVYSASLSSGLQVVVDAGTGEILHSEKSAGAEHEEGSEKDRRSEKEEENRGEEQEEE